MSNDPAVRARMLLRLLNHGRVGFGTPHGKRHPLATTWRALNRELDRFITTGLAAA
jgi:hypothetical protein